MTRGGLMLINLGLLAWNAHTYYASGDRVALGLGLYNLACLLLVVLFG